MNKTKKTSSSLKLFQSRLEGFFIVGLLQEIFGILREKISSLLSLSDAKLKRFLVVSINHATIEMIYVKSFLEGIQVLAFGMYQALPEGQGSEKSVEYFIADFLYKNSILEKDVLINLADGESVAMHSLTLPELPRGEVIEAAKWKLKVEIPFDWDKIQIDWRKARESVDDKGAKSSEMIFIAAETSTINNCLSSVYNCGLRPLGITAGPFHYANILKNLPEQPALTAVLDIDYAFSTLSIFNAGTLLFVRKLPISWEMLTKALTKPLESDKGNIKLSMEEAEEIKNAYGILEDETQTIKGHIRGTHIMSLLRPILEALVRELKLSLNYFTLNFEMEPPPQLFILGGGADLKNLEAFLHKELKIDVARMPVPGCVYLSTSKLRKADSHKDDLQKFVNVIGLALGSSETINLLPREIKAQKIEFLQRISLRVAGITLGAILLSMMFILKFQVKDYRNRIKNAQMHLQVIGGIKDLKRRVRVMEELIEKIQKGKIPGNSFLKVIGALTPSSVILDELIFDQSNHHLVLKGTVLVAEETAGSILSEFILQLESSFFFQEVRLISLQRTGGSQRFEIECEFLQ